MKRIPLILFLSFILTGFLTAQNVNRKDLTNTTWFVNNKNESFYKSDTISMVRIEKFNNHLEELNSQYIMLDYNKQNDVSKVELKANGKAEIVNILVKNWSESKFTDKWTWKFDNATKIISFYLKKRLYSRFKIFSVKNDTLTSKYGQSSEDKESKIKLIILIMKRIK